jgi:hypothetical protein
MAARRGVDVCDRAPLIATWATLKGDFDAVGAIFVFLLWMLYLGLLRWHYGAKSQARAVSRRHHG